jgi:hypothetical protein
LTIWGKFRPGTLANTHNRGQFTEAGPYKRRTDLPPQCTYHILACLTIVKVAIKLKRMKRFLVIISLILLLITEEETEV